MMCDLECDVIFVACCCCSRGRSCRLSRKGIWNEIDRTKGQNSRKVSKQFAPDPIKLATNKSHELLQEISLSRRPQQPFALIDQLKPTLGSKRTRKQRERARNFSDPHGLGKRAFVCLSLEFPPIDRSRCQIPNSKSQRSIVARIHRLLPSQSCHSWRCFKLIPICAVLCRAPNPSQYIWGAWKLCD